MIAPVSGFGKGSAWQSGWMRLIGLIGHADKMANGKMVIEIKPPEKTRKDRRSPKASLARMLHCASQAALCSAKYCFKNSQPCDADCNAVGITAGSNPVNAVISRQIGT